MLDHFAAPQMQRIDRENTERGNLRTAEAWLAQHEQDERLARMTPRHRDPEFLLNLREFIAFCVVIGAGCGLLLAIG